MESALKQRLVGAAVLVALGVIFIPMLLERGGEDARLSVQMDIPSPPDTRFENRLERARPPGEIEPLPPLEKSSEAVPDSAPESAPEPAVEPPQKAPPATEKAPADKEVKPPRGSDKPAAEPASKPAESEAAAAEEGRWIVQVGSFSREANALTLREKLNSAGFKAFVETAKANTGPVYRVRLEPVDERGEAEDQVKRLADKGGHRAIVLSHAD